MKKFMIFAAAAMTLLAACSKEMPSFDNPTQPSAPGLVTISGRAVVDATTKISSGNLSEGTSVSFTWDTGDKILVKNASGQGATYTLQSGNGTASAEFLGTAVPEANMVYAPYIPGSYTNGTEAMNATLNYCVTSQTYTAGTYDKNAFAFSGSLVGTSFTINPVGAIIMIALKGTATLDRIVITTDVTPSTEIGVLRFSETKTLTNTPETFYICTNAKGASYRINIYYNGGNVVKNRLYANAETDGVIDVSSDALTIAAKVPVGALPGRFKVSKSTHVRFAKGNLWCNLGADPVIWALENDQLGINHSYEASHVSHFYWETAGNYGAEHTCSTPSGASSDTVDWGDIYCEANGLAKGIWRGLSLTEAEYFCANNPFGLATINGVTGVIVLPIDFVDPLKMGDTDESTGAFANTHTAYTDNIYTATNWLSMETAGALFLPCSGYRFIREGAVMFSGTTDGYYWGTSARSTSEGWGFSFNATNGMSKHATARNSGYPVRLVTNAD